MMFEKKIEEYELIRAEYQAKIADRMGQRQGNIHLKIWLLAILCLATTRR